VPSLSRQSLPMIEVQDLQKLYDSTLAVSGISFALKPGDICGMVGPNGAGKTTTMRCLAGLITPTAGDMRVDGLSVIDDAIAVRRRLAYVPDDPPLFDDLTVGQHLDLIAGLYDVDHDGRRAESLLVQFGLAFKVNELANALSRGMRQKLAICCSYLYDPKVLLLDEPLTGLDPPGIRCLLESIRQKSSEGVTIILSSHLLAMIENVCTHVLVMQQGHVEFFGTAESLRRRHPEAATLEDAYFAATAQSTGAQAPAASPPINPIVFPMASPFMVTR
jgi:ABC-2 type transport system ATP-binding protein